MIESSRLAALRCMPGGKSWSHILIMDSVDVAYISGFVSSNVALLINRRKNRLFTDFRYHAEATLFCRQHPEWTYQPVRASMTDALAKFIPPGAVVGFQSDRMTVDELNALKKQTRGVRFVSCSERINEWLMVKYPEEIAAMQRAAGIGDAAFCQLIGDIRPGVTEQGLVRKLEQYCGERGSEKPSFDTIVLSGERSALPHGRPGPARLQRGEFVLIDFGCTIDGFSSDMTRTVVLGKATRRQRSLYRIVYEAQKKAREQAKAGMAASEIDALARDPIAGAGFAGEFGHALGHGVGRRIHEAPRISEKVSLRVPANTVITIEPGIYFSGFGGIRIEDMAVMEKDGARLLTHSPRELIEV